MVNKMDINAEHVEYVLGTVLECTETNDFIKNNIVIIRGEKELNLDNNIYNFEIGDDYFIIMNKQDYLKEHIFELFKQLGIWGERTSIYNDPEEIFTFMELNKERFLTIGLQTGYNNTIKMLNYLDENKPDGWFSDMYFEISDLTERAGRLL